jgi:hypothetical protein
MEEVEPPFFDDAPPALCPKPKAKRKSKNPTAPKNSEADPAAPQVFATMAEALEPKIKNAAKNPKATPGSKMDPEWYAFYRVLADTGDSLLKSLLSRSDIPTDALRLIEAVLCLRESKDLFFAQGERLTPAAALFWADELNEWANK